MEEQYVEDEDEDLFDGADPDHAQQAMDVGLDDRYAKREQWIRALMETKMDKLKETHRAQMARMSKEVAELRERERELQSALDSAQQVVAERDALRARVADLEDIVAARGDAYCGTEAEYRGRVLAQASADLPPELMDHLRQRCGLLSERVEELRAGLSEGTTGMRFRLDRPAFVKQREKMQGLMSQNQGELQRTQIIQSILVGQAAAVGALRDQRRADADDFARRHLQLESYARHLEDREAVSQWNSARVIRQSLPEGRGGTSAAPTPLDMSDVHGERKEASSSASDTAQDSATQRIGISGGEAVINGDGNNPASSSSSSAAVGAVAQGRRARRGDGMAEALPRLSDPSTRWRPALDLERTAVGSSPLAGRLVLPPGRETDKVELGTLRAGPKWMLEPVPQTGPRALTDALRSAQLPGPPATMYSVRVGRWSSKNGTTVWSSAGCFDKEGMHSMFERKTS